MSIKLRFLPFLVEIKQVLKAFTMQSEKQMKVHFERIKKANYRESLRLEGITVRTGKVKSKVVAEKIRELRAQHA